MNGRIKNFLIRVIYAPSIRAPIVTSLTAYLNIGRLLQVTVTLKVTVTSCGGRYSLSVMVIDSIVSSVVKRPSTSRPSTTLPKKLNWLLA